MGPNRQLRCKSMNLLSLVSQYSYGEWVIICAGKIGVIVKLIIFSQIDAGLKPNYFLHLNAS